MPPICSFGFKRNGGTVTEGWLGGGGTTKTITSPLLRAQKSWRDGWRTITRRCECIGSSACICANAPLQVLPFCLGLTHSQLRCEVCHAASGSCLNPITVYSIWYSNIRAITTQEMQPPTVSSVRIPSSGSMRPPVRGSNVKLFREGHCIIFRAVETTTAESGFSFFGHELDRRHQSSDQNVMLLLPQLCSPIPDMMANVFC